MYQETLALLRQRKEQMTDICISGLSSWDKYQRVLGTLDALNWVEQELKLLQSKWEREEDGE